MSGDDIARIAYLGLLGAAIAGWFIAENRKDLGRTARQAIIWGLIFLGFIAAAGLWSDIRDDVMPRQAVLSEGNIEVPRNFDGHFYLTLFLNNVPVEFMVDTGASDVVLSLDDAERIGLDRDSLSFIGTAITANGTVKTAPARLIDVRLGSFREPPLNISVNGGEMDGSLLGMAYLRRFESVEFRGDRLLLRR